MKPQLTLRDLFWLIFLVALATGWWLDHRATREEIQRTGADVQRFMTNIEDQTRAMRAENDSLQQQLLRTETVLAQEAARQQSRATVDNMPIIRPRQR